ncbi:MAG: DUF2029 domain-containing protein [Anaerolineaceae bacterium]|nr:DUF2029 domain-containing protein [Anaerolineaceae bacterium]
MNKRYRSTALSQYLMIVLILVGAVALGSAGFWMMSRLPFTDHFALPWAAGRAWLLGGESPYGATVATIASNAIDGSPFLAVLPESQVYANPLPSLVFYLPFSLMPYTVARTIWVLWLVISVGFIVFMSINLSGWKISLPGKLFVSLVVLLWLPGVDVIMGGHLSPVIIALLLFSIYMVLTGQDTTAGFILALTFNSFLTTGLVLLLILVWAISRKRWSILASYFSGLVFLILIAFLIYPSWFTEWASVLLNMNISWEWFQSPLMALSALLPGIAEPFAILLHGIFGIYALVLLITTVSQSGRVFIYKIFSFFLITYLLHAQGSTVYLFYIVPAFLLMMRYMAERWKRLGYLLSWVFLTLIGVGSWLLTSFEVDFTQPLEMPLIYVGFPLFVIFGMVYIRWWALKIPKLPYETF